MSHPTKADAPQSIVHLEFLPDGRTPTVSSLDVARHFQKKHLHVLRDIDRLRSMLPKVFTESNFGFSEYKDATGRSLPCYRLTRDAFSLLVMGFTGKAAVQWKLRYIEAFNALEAAALENIRLEGRREGVTAARSLSAFQDAHMDAILRYRGMGLTQRETAKLLGCCADTVGAALRRYRAMGLEV